MALSIVTRLTGFLVTAAAWNELVNGINGESVALDTVEATTTNTSGTVGIGNQRLSDRLGAGVTNTANVTTGTVTAQTTDLRARVAVVEGVTTNTSGAVGIGNQRLSDRLGAGVDNTTNVTTGTVTAQTTDLRARVAVLEAAGVAVVPRLSARQVNGATQTITANTPVAITMTAEDQDNINGHSTSSLTSRYTPNVAGEYECHGAVAVDNALTSGTAVTAQFRKNGAVSLRGSYGILFAQSQGSVANVCMANPCTFQMNGTTDYIELWGNSSATTTTFANTTDQISYMLIKRIGP